MAEDCAVAVDLAVLEGADGTPRSVLAWGDRARVLRRDGERCEVEVAAWREAPGGGLERQTWQGTVARRLRVGGQTREVLVPIDESRVLQVSFVDVQQGDAALVVTPGGKVLTVDGGENQLFARFLASRYPATSPTDRLDIDAMIVSHGDADHFEGLTEVRRTETEADLDARKRLFVHPHRVYHNGLVKRPGSAKELDQLGPTVPSGGRTVITGLVDDPRSVPAAERNRPFKSWCAALDGWQEDGPVELRRLARGCDDAFDFLDGEGVRIDVLAPIETRVGGQAGLPFLPAPKAGSPLAHLRFEPGPLSASHTINGHSLVLRLRYGNVRVLLAGDLNQAVEETLAIEHARGDIDLQAEVLKVPHHGSHEFTTPFLDAVAPLVSVVSSGDESSRHEYIHPRATLVSALGRASRSDAGVVLITELVAFFEAQGWVVPNVPPKAGAPAHRPFFGFRRTAYGLVRVRTDGHRLLVFSDTGKRDLKEAYAYEVPSPGEVVPAQVQRA